MKNKLLKYCFLIIISIFLFSLAWRMFTNRRVDPTFNEKVDRVFNNDPTIRVTTADTDKDITEEWKEIYRDEYEKGDYDTIYHDMFNTYAFHW